MMEIGGVGLRERKRLASMRRIQEVALDLFDADSYAAVTVEQIAEASEVSPSSVYRYFGTKENILLWDEFDSIQLELLDGAFADAVPLDGARRALEEVVARLAPEDEEQFKRRVRLIMGNPVLEQASVGTTYVLAEAIGEALARRLGRPAFDLEVQVFAHAFVGGMLGMVHHWHGSGFAEPLADVLARTFTVFEEGLDVVAATEA